MGDKNSLTLKFPRNVITSEPSCGNITSKLNGVAGISSEEKQIQTTVVGRTR